MMRVHKKFCLLSLILLFVSAGLLVGGCSDDDSTTDDFLPNVTMSINALDFGEIPLDTFLIETVTIRNLLNENVTIERVTSTNEVFRVGGYFAGGNLFELEVPFTIEPNGARTLYIGFYPDAEGNFVGKVVIESTSETSGDETDLVDLQGVGLPDLE
ncbi:hypothetical protein GF339_16620 [candidate division KSB3 bacterium]|uniref:DUF1573 domain-containing protein n=1 Tax=candidate division KSB3 bacterium TaxID=2044937 RepID=A0A9D5JXS9_9BACT|nr:hypothetical protein [candidate division KSB3 bacterium]MBD3326213.1 hypothetical protein [candidate division KSB3 bacterium]